MKVYTGRQPGEFVFRFHAPNSDEGWSKIQGLSRALPEAYRVFKSSIERTQRPSSSESRGGQRVSVSVIARYRGKGEMKTIADMTEVVDELNGRA